ncbi:fimbrial protein [Dyella sp. A6]|uniref:fimbrial protein n=1 Tax=Dyella aluminiiresistens TaxID=3069105 RepID=UPI002E784E88|nr:fimbrial protein [Dyella sp. A6]
MHAIASIFPLARQRADVKVLFYSPDEARAERLAARLHKLANVQWEDSRLFSPERWERQEHGQHLILLDYSPGHAQASTALASRLTALAPGLPLFGVGATTADNAAGVLAALRAGVLDFLDMDASDEDIRTLLEHALELPTNARAQGTQATRRRGQLILLLGVRPGVGTSTLAAHLGVQAMPPRNPTDKSGNSPADPAMEEPAARALLLDLGQPAGDTELYLGVVGEFHFSDALRNASRIDATLLRTALSRHSSRLAVLSQGTGKPLPAADAAEAGVLVDRLLDHMDLMLCDLGGLSAEQIPHALLQTADEIWLVAEQSIGAMVSLDARLRELERAGVRDHRLSLIVNRYDSECAVTAEQIAKRFDLTLLATLPSRMRALRGAASQGLLLHQLAPRDPYIRALAPLLARLRISTPRASAKSRWKKLIPLGGATRWKAK